MSKEFEVSDTVSEDGKRLTRTIRQVEDSREERVARAVMTILWRREQYNGVGPDYETYRESMGGRVASYEREAEEIARAAIAALSPDARLIEALDNALRTTDAYHLTALKFRNGQCCYADLNSAALAKEDARQFLSTTKAGQPTITQKIVERRPFVIEDEADQ